LRCHQSSPNVRKSTSKWYDLFTYGQRQRKSSKENTQTWHRSSLFRPPLTTKEDEGNLLETQFGLSKQKDHQMFDINVLSIGDPSRGKIKIGSWCFGPSR